MKLVAIMPVRNEAWVLGLSARAALMWCDELVIGLHACTDDSERIAAEVSAEHAGRVTVIDLAGDVWAEMVHRQQLLETARSRGASHVAIVDADEILTGSILRDIRGVAEKMELVSIMQLPGYNLRGGIEKYHATGIWSDRWFGCIFRDDPQLNWQGDRFHHREPMGQNLRLNRPFQQDQGGLMHLWGASERRLRAKHAHYKVTERVRWPEKSVSHIEELYSLAIHGSPREEFGRPHSWQYRDVPAAWWEPYQALMGNLDINAEPWQEREVRRAVETHGAAHFAGLDLFGVAQ